MTTIQTVPGPATAAPAATAPPSGTTPRPRTVVPGAARVGTATAPAVPQARRNLSTLRREDVLRLVGAFAAAVAATAWLCTQVLPVRGVLPAVLIGYALFLAFSIVLVGFDEDRVTVTDRVISIVIHTSAVLLLLALVVVVVFTLGRGADAFRHANFWTQDLSLAGPLDPMTVGGMAHAAAGTLIMIAFALAIAVPLGLLCAVFLSEFPSPFARVVRTVTEAMTALPSIVCGLFIYATYVLMFGLDKSGFAASLAITIMILPIVIRSADVVLRLVPATLKEAALATGASHWRTVWHVVLPTSRSGLTTAVVLGTARGIGETSPVLLTAGYTTFYNWNPFSGPMVSLPFATFTLVKSPEATQIARGFGAAAVLMVLVFVLFLVARVIGGRGPGVLTAGGLKRARRASQRLAARFEARDRAAQGAAPVAVGGAAGEPPAAGDVGPTGATTWTGAGR